MMKMGLMLHRIRLTAMAVSLILAQVVPMDQLRVMARELEDGDVRDADASDPGDWTVAGFCSTDSSSTNGS